MCLRLISQVSILAESCWSVLIFHQTVQCLHPIPISSISNWVNMKNITSFMEGKRNSSQTAQIPSVEGKWGCPSLHFGVRLDLGCWRGTILQGDEALFTSRYEQLCGWTAEQQQSSWQSPCAIMWHRVTHSSSKGHQCLCLPQTRAHVCTGMEPYTNITQQWPSAKRAKKAERMIRRSKLPGWCAVRGRINLLPLWEQLPAGEN